LKTPPRKLHFKDFAREKVRELGMDGAVMYFLKKKRYYDNNPLYEKSWLYSSVYSMILEYIVNDLGE